MGPSQLRPSLELAQRCCSQTWGCGPTNQSAHSPNRCLRGIPRSHWDSWATCSRFTGNPIRGGAVQMLFACAAWPRGHRPALSGLLAHSCRLRGFCRTLAIGRSHTALVPLDSDVLCLHFGSGQPFALRLQPSVLLGSACGLQVNLRWHLSHSSSSSPRSIEIPKSTSSLISLPFSCDGSEANRGLLVIEATTTAPTGAAE